MNRVKTFIKYAIWIILFWIFSEILINVGLKTTYKKLENIGNIPSGIQIIEMKATAVNGVARLSVNDTSLSKQYVKIDLYSENDNLLGTQYLEIGNVQEGHAKEINTSFKIKDVKKYEISIVKIID